MIKQLAEVFSLQAALVTIALGVLILIVDQQRMRQSKLATEAVVSRVIGWIYVVAPVVIWVGLQITVRMQHP